MRPPNPPADDLELRERDLYAQLEVIRREREERTRQANIEQGNFYLAVLPTLLILAPKHSKSGYENCTDDRPDNREECVRCALLAIQRDQDWQGWPLGLEVDLVLMGDRDACGSRQSVPAA